MLSTLGALLPDHVTSDHLTTRNPPCSHCSTPHAVPLHVLLYPCLLPATLCPPSLQPLPAAGLAVAQVPKHLLPLAPGTVVDGVEGILVRMEDHVTGMEVMSVRDTATQRTFVLPEWPVDVIQRRRVQLATTINFVSPV